MKRTLLFLFCALISTQMFSESSSPYGTATSFARTDVASTTFNNDIEDISSDLRKKYLVEKITWYDDETNHKEAYYEYDNNNRLVRRIIHNTYFEQGRVKHDTIVDNYEYTEGNLTKISHKDVYVSYTYDLEYDNAGRLITSKYVNNIMHFCYRGGKMDSIWYDNAPECYTILKYDEHGNIVKEIKRVPEMDDIGYPTGNYVFRENEYEYDDKIRPFFNTDNAFVYDPLFGQGDAPPTYIRMLSTNNLIKYSRSSWHYTYNEEGLPIELRTSFEGVTPVNDPKYVFTYRKIKKTESLADLFPTLTGLQRTTCLKNINENEVGTVWGSNSYLMQEIETTTIDGKQYLLFGTNNTYDEYWSLWLREENNKILVYSAAQKKDLVLFDFTLNVGDSLLRLYVDEELSSIVDYYKYEADWEYTKPLFVTEVSTITLLDGKEYKKWTFDNGMEYVEGIGSFGTSYAWNDFYQLIANGPLYSDVFSQHLVCASKNGKLLYQMDDAEMEQLGAECLCEYNAEQKPEDLFPTLWGLQRTHTVEMYDYAPNDGKRSGGYPLPFASIKDTVINGKTYLQFGDYVNGSDYSLFFLREENNKVLIYSSILQNDLVLYDYTLELGDSLPAITSDHDYFSDNHFTKLDKAENIFTYVVTDVSTVTLLDGIERKKWILKNKYLPIIEYVEGIGCYGENTSHSGDFFRLIYDYPYTTEYVGDHLVCVSQNGQLLYSMTQEEMDGFTLTCKCLSQSSYKSQWCNQWNILSHGQESDPDEPFPHARTNIYWLSENTINRNGYEYIPLMCSSSKQDVQSTHLVGELRFTEDKQVYFYYDNTEYLLYDFGAQVGDQLQIFSGINNYNYYDYYETYTHVVTRREYLDDGRIKLTSIPFFGDPVPDDINENNYLSVTWIEGVGSEHGIVHNNINNLPGMGTEWLLCAYRDDECRYTTDDPEYAPLGCVYNEGDVISAVEHVSVSTPSVQKIIKDGQLLILRDGKTYNIMGVEVGQ